MVIEDTFYLIIFFLVNTVKEGSSFSKLWIHTIFNEYIADFIELTI